MTLCTTLSTIPAVIPEGKNAVSYRESYWWSSTYDVQANGTIVYLDCLYKCLNGSCHPCSTSTHINYIHYSDVNNSCLTINNVLEKERRHYFLDHFIAPEYVIPQDAIFISIQFIVSELDEPPGVTVCVCVCVCVHMRVCRITLPNTWLAWFNKNL